MEKLNLMDGVTNWLTSSLYTAVVTTATMTTAEAFGEEVDAILWRGHKTVVPVTVTMKEHGLAVDMLFGVPITVLPNARNLILARRHANWVVGTVRDITEIMINEG